jgi:ABC-type multidrug transport system fused ATPase/permease subunit
MRDGRAVEQGTHAELMENKGGAYASLVALQMAGTDGEGKQ